jgi:CHAT domain-containing protein
MLTNNVFNLYLQETDGEGMERTSARLAQLLPTKGGSEHQQDGSAASTSLGVEWMSWQLAEEQIRTSAVLAPLYRARRAREDGDDASANALLKQAEVALDSVGEDQRDFLTSAVLAEAKRYEEAAAAFRAHLARGGTDAGLAGTLLQSMRALGGPSAEGEARLQQSRTHDQAFSMFVRLKAYAEAKTHLEKLEQLDGPRWWEPKSRPWEALSDCGETYEGLGEHKRALDFYDLAISTLEARRGQLGRDELKSALAAGKGAQYLYLSAARTAIKLGERERAFGYCERGKARALLDLMAGTAAALKETAEESSEMRRWRELSARLQLKRGLLAQTRSRQQPDAERMTQLAREIAADETDLAQTETRLARIQPDFLRVVSREAPTFSVEQVAAALPPGAVLLEYFFVGEDFLCWAVDREGLQQACAATADMRALTRDIRAFHQGCASRAPIDALAEQLARRFFDPLAATIRGAERLIVVPYGAAHMLPFHALPFDGKPLAAERTVSYLPSASTLQFLSLGRVWRTPENILAVGNPTGDLPDLPAAEAEAAYVASLFGTQALIGKDANEKAVRARIPSARLLHFATHGELSEEAPLSSWIALADNEQLTLYELMGLRMDAELVVLSACETGQGQTTGGDDVVGLTRGLLGAGARAALVSLWPVDDVATSLLMGEFYRRLIGGDTSIIALCKAQNCLRSLAPARIDAELAKLGAALKQARSDTTAQTVDRARSERHSHLAGSAAKLDYSHPYYWAPFVLVG